VPERLDTESMPLTEPHWPPTFDTGPHPKPLGSGEPEPEPEPIPAAAAEPDPDHDPWRPTSSEPEVLSWPGPFEEHRPVAEPQQVPPAHPVAVPGHYQYLKRWKFALLLLGVWVIAAVVGAGCFYWWYHTLDKTWPDFAVLIYVIVCVVSALLVSLVEGRPMVSATAIAVMSAPFASGLAAAALYGMYAFTWIQP
jgi:hypothetical protein